MIKNPRYLVETGGTSSHIGRRMLPSSSQAAELTLENIHASRTRWKGCLYMCQDVLPCNSQELQGSTRDIVT